MVKAGFFAAFAAIVLFFGSIAAGRAMDRMIGPDTGIMWGGRFVQLEHLRCIADPHAVWFEDGSAICGERARNWAP